MKSAIHKRQRQERRWCSDVPKGYRMAEISRGMGSHSVTVQAISEADVIKAVAVNVAK